MIAAELLDPAAALRENRARLRRSMAAALKPIDAPATADWCERAIRLARDVEAGAGALELFARPWWREILNLYDDPEVRTVDIVASTQVGKTLTLIASIFAAAKWRPAPGLVCLPDRDAAIEFRDRVYFNALASPELRELVPPPHRWNARYIDLRTMRVYLAWSGSRQRLRGRPCRWVWLSEVDVYFEGDKRAGNPVAAAANRVKSFYRSLILRESSPSEDPSIIAGLEAAAGDRRRWTLKCPRCGREQEPRFFVHKAGPLAGRGGIDGARDEAGQLRDETDARRLTRYVCETPACELTPAEIPEALQLGEWRAKGDPAGDRPPAASRRSVGLHLWSIHSATISIADIVAAYIEHAREGRLPEFFQNWLGIPFTPPSKIPDWRQAGQRLAWPNPRGHIPPDCWFLTAGGDVQEDETIYTVRGWAPNGKSYLVDWLRIPRQPDDEGELVKTDLAQLRPLMLDRTYPIADGKANPLGRKALRVRLFCIDSNFRTLDVHNWLRSLPPEWTRNEDPALNRVRAIRGDHTVDPAVKWRLSTLEQNVRTGQKYVGGLEQWQIYIYHYWQDLATRLASLPGQPSSYYLCGEVNTAADGKLYLQQLTNFHNTLERKDGKRPRRVWKAKSNAQGYDYWATSAYELVAADMICGELGWLEADWRAAWIPQPVTKRRRRQRDSYADR